ncbi:kinase-like domain-containing protein [Scleroderma yunnanense]
MNLGIALEDLSQRASRYCINLNELVDRDDTFPPLRGSSALVYRGTLRREGAKVAVKTFRSGPSGNEATLKLVFRELHLWSKLRHENIVRLLGVTTTFDFTVSIVSEWMAKGDAYNYVQDTSIDPRPLLVGIAHGLHYLHNHPQGPIFHGDLKGLNVLISDDGRALLCDFGLSYLVMSTFSMTVECPRGGSIPWMAPESLDSDWVVTAATDIWAFGMTTLELFTRVPPFHPSPNPTSVMVKILRGVPNRPSMESACSRLTDEWWNLCLLCWNREPSLRPSMSDIVDRVMKDADHS